MISISVNTENRDGTSLHISTKTPSEALKLLDSYKDVITNLSINIWSSGNDAMKILDNINR
mgnify:FL=1